jgi:rRNA maturation protein Nop10
MAKKYCQDCGATLMPTLRMCPTCGSKNLDANPPKPSIQAVTSHTRTTTASASQLNGLGGWLILVGFGLIFGALRLFVQSINIYKPYLNTDLLEKLTDPLSANFIPNFKILFYSEFLVQLFLLFLTVYLVYLFFMKKKSFPKNYIFISLFVVLYIPVDAYLVSVVVPNEKVLDGELIKTFFQAMLSGAIWIPYMLKSERVRNTFIID